MSVEESPSFSRGRGFKVKGEYYLAPGCYQIELSQSPTPEGVGMSREGYGQQVDKEA